MKLYIQYKELRRGRMQGGRERHLVAAAFGETPVRVKLGNGHSSSGPTFSRIEIARHNALPLEPLIAAHAHEMFSVLSDPAIYGFENEAPTSEEWLARRYEQLEQRG